ncbi:pyridoxamine 5'-phosphate oxidase family protein [Oceaniglobus roseus]|uniref:pyridoxamine 5'-phosphate oxidase family protein n=1 Tax=Oceaniglobus roseus TaxID=1737570 RepID=UPI000C7EA3E5|nr:pyridoxamine 5'-phosphate oxidase family protein [Kandeliimicrobium roseum]
MSDLSRDEAHAALTDLLSDVRAGMLGLKGSDQHMQPMTHHHDPEASTLWFITSRKTDLARAVENGTVARFTATKGDQRAWASMTGTIAHSADTAKLDEIWSSVAAAWFDKGRDDPDICLLEMRLAEAAVWTATGNPLVFGLEIARANLNEERKPDIGSHAVIGFSRAA